MVNKKILLVDDDRLVLGSVAAKLEAAGYRVWMTDSAIEAVELAKQVQPNVVVTDLRMPAMDGVALLRQLKRCARGAPRLCIYTAAPRPDQFIQQMEGVLWISKTTGHRALLSALEVGTTSVARLSPGSGGVA